MQPVFKTFCLMLSVGDHALICIFDEMKPIQMPENRVLFPGFEELEPGVMGRSAKERAASEWRLQPPKIPETDDRFPQGTFFKMFVCPNDRYFPFTSPYLNVQPKADFCSMSLFYKALKLSEFYVSLI